MSIAAVEILEVGEKSLDELAAVANREHQETCEALVTSLAHAIRCGEALLEAYERIGPADWTVWAAANLKMSPITISEIQANCLLQRPVASGNMADAYASE